LNTFLFFRRAQSESAEKTSEDGLNVTRRRVRWKPEQYQSIVWILLFRAEFPSFKVLYSCSKWNWRTECLRL